MSLKNESLFDITDLSLKIEGEGIFTQILSSLTFSIKQGECLAVIGKSGSGKSITALSLLHAFKNDNSFKYTGEIRSHSAVEEEQLFQMSDNELREFRRTEVAYISQESENSLNPSYKIDYQLRQILQHIVKAPEDTHDLEIGNMLRNLDIENPKTVLNSYPFQLSGGQLQRITIAMALLKKPSLIIFDEPCSSLDIIRQQQVLSIIKSIKEKQETAILYITHDLNMISTWVDRIMIINEGKIVAIGQKESNDILNNKHYLLMNAAAKLSSLPDVQKEAQKSVLLQMEDISIFYPKAGRTLTWNIQKEYIIEALSLKIFETEIVGICGLSGSGKSTLIKSICGLHNLWEGQLEFDGVPLPKFKKRNKTQKKSIQLVMQNSFSSLNPSMRVKRIFQEIFHVNGYYDSNSGLDENINLIFNKVGLPVSVSQRFPHELSGGQRQRLNLARALAQRPSLLVCDESISSLDKITQKDILDLLLELRKTEKLTILFISHDFKALSYFADRILIMHSGKIIQDGSHEEILQNPNNAYVERLTSGIRKN